VYHENIILTATKRILEFLFLSLHNQSFTPLHTF